MKKLITNVRPHSFDIYLCYRCECGFSHWVEKQTTKYPHKIDCCCGKTLQIEPIQKINIEYVMKDEVQYGHHSTHGRLITTAKDILHKYGYTNIEIKTMLGEVDMSKINEVSQLIKECLKGVKV